MRDLAQKDVPLTILFLGLGPSMVPVSLPPLVASDCRAGVREEVWLWVEGGDFGKPPFGPLFLFDRPAGLNGM